VSGHSSGESQFNQTDAAFVIRGAVSIKRVLIKVPAIVAPTTIHNGTANPH
jgi:hypothetical protein